jgi:hypothetical protein
MHIKTKKCPLCSGTKTVKRGTTSQGKQLYWCKGCGHRFTSAHTEKEIDGKHIWIDFVFHKQTLRELSPVYDMNKKTVYAHLNAYTVKEKKHEPRPVHLLADALYFGMRKKDTTWCVVVFRDADSKENLWWQYTTEETESIYREGRTYLEQRGYSILSVTGDGFGGLRSSFLPILFQMCLVHMERIVVRGTTRKPKLLQGQVLLALTRTLFDTTEELFTQRLQHYIETYRDFLNEKATSDLTGESWFVHADLRKAVLSLRRFLPYLFTYEKDKSIPRTTNSLEGHFSHLRDVVNIHRGASPQLKQKIIHTILLASTIAPTDEEIRKIV